ncbi:manganese-binding transcriptional regulator MntR [Halomonas aquamarina]|uniref:Manganese-binding transcriptional regulator MntR n=1 Tax=Vreelandella aquamarina TaxID=77097 RepID=A0ACC5VT86_9GAMM|nr:manganese-binding transcriptional regulator MntR [Halomonas aquamarina]MBZ5486867.1 manganese-binding transcriptional regulator MntR [Halomonas aquamarina]
MSDHDQSPHLSASSRNGNSGDALPPVGEHARQYETVRNAHETELIEDYVELIGDLLQHRGEARAADIATRMGVSQATVSKMIRRLNELGLVTSKPYRSLFLTEEGQKMAETSRARHDIVLHFLRALGVDDHTARIDAEGMEHHVSNDTLAIMQRFIDEHAKP